MVRAGTVLAVFSIVDRVRPHALRRQILRRFLGPSLLIVVIAGLAVGGRQSLSSSLPEVQRNKLWIAQVEQKELVREVLATGSLVPRHEQWITAVTAGRVESIETQPGQTVAPETVIVQLVNPELTLGVLQAESELATAKSMLAEQKANLGMQILTLKSQVVSLESEGRSAQRKLNIARQLAPHQAIAPEELLEHQEVQRSLARRLSIEEERLSLLHRARRAQVQAQENRVSRLEAMVEFKRDQLARLRVESGRSGVVREFLVVTGAWINPGTVIAKVIAPDDLIARLQVSEATAKDLTVNLRVRAQLPQGVVQGIVARVDPAVKRAQVEIDVELIGALPPGSRPDLSVSGIVELERVARTLQIRRPARARANARLKLFRLDVSAGNATATQVEVLTGRTSIDQIEIVRGLNEGDEVIISDMSAWENAERVSIK